MNLPGDYAAALETEQRIYADCLEVHQLPASFHYWSNRHLLPKLLPHGFNSPDGMFLKVLREQCERIPSPRFVSLGAGNADLELTLARALRDLGHRNFVIECLDLNAAMLERGRQAAEWAQLSRHFEFVQADFNTWTATGPYDAVIANQSLHHVLNLEGLFEQIRNSLQPTGAFAISDMIGRNGHLRWPEALRIVREFWRQLPPSYRHNAKLGGYEEIFADWDCSVEGFEGIRSQDVLPLLLDHFHFQIFIPFGNLIDPFIDRAFGNHFDVTAEWDRDFLDRVHQRDERELADGTITPTHLLAVVTKSAGPESLSPALLRRSVRDSELPGSIIPVLDAYDWAAWPHSPQRELEMACARLAESESGRLVRERTAWALKLERELQERTRLALEWRQELDQRTRWAKSLECDVVERTAWAFDLEEQLSRRTAWCQSLVDDLQRHAQALDQMRAEFHETREWARQLEAELTLRTQWARRLEQEVSDQQTHIQKLDARLRNPFLYGVRRVIAWCVAGMHLAWKSKPSELR
jgi:SAM-dependent methyltransferase